MVLEKKGIVAMGQKPADQPMVPDGENQIDLGKTVDFSDDENFELVIDSESEEDGGDMLGAVSSEAGLDRDQTEFVVNDRSAEEIDVPRSAGTAVLDEKARLDDVIARIYGVKVKLLRSRAKSRDTAVILSPQDKDIDFGGSGLSDEEFRDAAGYMALSESPEDLDVVLGCLRDVQAIRFQRRHMAKVLDPDPEKRAKGDPADFGLDHDQQRRMLGLLRAALQADSIPNDGIHLLMNNPIELMVAFGAFLRTYIDLYHCSTGLYVVPDYSLSPQEAIALTRCVRPADEEVDPAVLASAPKAAMPAHEGDRIVFFQMGRNASPFEVKERYRKLGLRPLDLWELCAFNAKNQNFLIETPNTICWTVGGDLRLAAFYTHDGDPIQYVSVKRPVLKEGFVKGWFFAGVPIAA